MTENESNFDIISLLYRHNLIYILEDIFVYAGYQGVLSGLTTCTDWNFIINSLGSWKSLLKIQLKKDPCSKKILEGCKWMQEKSYSHGYLSKIFHQITDFKTDLKLINKREKFPLYTTLKMADVMGEIPTSVLMVYKDYVYCGMKNGLVHVWDLSESCKFVTTLSEGELTTIDSMDVSQDILITVDGINKKTIFWDIDSHKIITETSDKEDHGSMAVALDLNQETLIGINYPNDWIGFRVVLWKISKNNLEETELKDYLLFDTESLEDISDYYLDKSRFTVSYSEFIVVYGIYNHEFQRSLVIPIKPTVINDSISYKMATVAAYHDLLAYRNELNINIINVKSRDIVRQILLDDLGIYFDFDRILHMQLLGTLLILTLENIDGKMRLIYCHLLDNEIFEYKLRGENYKMEKSHDISFYHSYDKRTVRVVWSDDVDNRDSKLEILEFNRII